MRLIPFAVVLALGVASCKTRDFEAHVKEDRAKSKVVTLKDDLHVYHYTNDALAKTNPSEYIKGAVAESRKNAALDVNKMPELAVVGYGLYVVDDPFSSRHFGQTLVRVPLKARTQITFTDAMNASEMPNAFRSNIDVLGYEWASVTQSAAVVRVGSGLELTQAKTFDCSRNEMPLSKRNFVSATNIVLESVCDIFFIAPTLISSAKPLENFVKGDDLTDWGAAIAMLADTLSDAKALAGVQKNVIDKPATLARVSECATVVKTGFSNAPELCLTSSILSAFVFSAAGMEIGFGEEPKLLFDATGVLPRVPVGIGAMELQKQLADAWKAKASVEQKKSMAVFFEWILKEGEKAKENVFASWRD